MYDAAFTSDGDYKVVHLQDIANLVRASFEEENTLFALMFGPLRTAFAKPEEMVTTIYERSHDQIATWIRSGETPRSFIDQFSMNAAMVRVDNVRHTNRITYVEADDFCRAVYGTKLSRGYKVRISEAVGKAPDLYRLTLTEQIRKYDANDKDEGIRPIKTYSAGF